MKLGHVLGSPFYGVVEISVRYEFGRHLLLYHSSADLATFGSLSESLLNLTPKDSSISTITHYKNKEVVCVEKNKKNDKKGV